MKSLYLSALLILITAGSSFAAENSFVLAMDYASYLRMADNNAFDAAKEELNKTSYDTEKKVPMESDIRNDEEKWNTVKDFKAKPRNLSGGGFVNTNDRVSVGAFAGYEFDERDETRQNENYSVKFNVKMAL